MGLGDLPGGSVDSRAFGISADGFTVVGTSQSDQGQEAVRWTLADGLVGLQDLGGPPFQSSAFAVSADGSVVVGGGASSSGPEAFRWTAGDGMVGLGDFVGGPPPDFFSRAFGVSADGEVVVGQGKSTNGFEAFRWTQADDLEGLGDLPGPGFFSEARAVSADGSVVVGRSDSPSAAFRWTASEMMAPLGDLCGGGCSSEAWGVSADGLVVVGVGETASGQEAFRWVGGQMTSLGEFEGGAHQSHAYDASADGSVVVGFGTTDAGQEAFVWDATNGMRNLRRVLVNDFGLDLTGWTLHSARAVSDDGLTFVGEGTNPDGDPEGWIARIAPPIEASASIYWTDRSFDEVQRADPDGENPATLYPSGGSNPFSVAVEQAAGRIYWADNTSGQIKRADLDGSGPAQTLVSSEFDINGLALDPGEQKMYWNLNGGDIRVADLDGNGVGTLIVTGARDIALDLVNRKIYWTDNVDREIKRAGLDGLDVETVVLTPFLQLGGGILQGIAVDPLAGKVYWAASGTPGGKIGRANLDGSGVEAGFITGLETPVGIDLALPLRKVYWADLDANKIQRGDLDDASIVDVVTAADFDMGFVTDVVFVRPECGDGLDNDGDGYADAGDAACLFGPLEIAAALPCDDGADNDGDGLFDSRPPPLGDPGCASQLSTPENPRCQDGIDNDPAAMDGTDFDGGESVLGVGNGDPLGPDPQCVGKPSRNSEGPGSCGLGFEFLLVLLPLWLHRRMRREERWR